jgi:cytosine/adenosine deaminase-related metal-dependent hydrolase
MPAAINAHTHLELTEYAGAIPEGLPFAEWIVAVVRASRQRTQADFQRASEAGVRMLLANATAAVGEICTHGASVEPIVASGLRGVVYYELLGVDPEQAPAILARGQRQLKMWAERYPGASVRFGLSLHTPYTVSARLFQLASEWRRAEGAPLCIHAAESQAETQWLLDGSGPIADTIYASAGWPITPRMAPGCSPMAYLERLGVLAAHPMLVHGVQVSQDDLDLLARRRIAVAHCPRSNVRLGCGRMPYAAYERTGVRVALGTDSLASAPSLSLWDEAAAAYATHRDAGETVSPATLLRHATLDGAVALGVENELGSLESGKLAQLACASLSPLSEREREDAQSVLTALLEGWLEPAPVYL